MQNQKIIISITGATGAIYGIRLLEILKELPIETHLIISKAAILSIKQETADDLDKIKSLASFNYNVNDIGAAIASGSFKTNGMIIAPCSMKTLSSIAYSYEDNLISRAANVVLKEQRKLVLMVRETPLHAGYLENMLRLARLGAIIAPPMPAFYHHPQNINDLINHSVGRVLDLFDINTAIVKRWQGLDFTKKLD